MDAATRKMVDEMTNDMPLRSLVLFSGGKLSFGLVEAFAAILNGRYVAGYDSWSRGSETPDDVACIPTIYSSRLRGTPGLSNACTRFCTS